MRHKKIGRVAGRGVIGCDVSYLASRRDADYFLLFSGGVARQASLNHRLKIFQASGLRDRPV